MELFEGVPASLHNLTKSVPDPLEIAPFSKGTKIVSQGSLDSVILAPNMLTLWDPSYLLGLDYNVHTFYKLAGIVGNISQLLTFRSLIPAMPGTLPYWKIEPNFQEGATSDDAEGK